MSLSKILKRVLASALIVTMNSGIIPFSNLSMGTAYASAPGNISSNLSFWLKTDSGIDLNSGFTWADSSTNGRDVANSTPATTPTLAINDINFNTGVLFDGDNDYLMSLGNPLWTTDPNFTMFVIGRPQKTFEPVAFLGHGDTNAADGGMYFQMIDTQFSVKDEGSAFYMGPSTIDRPSIVKISRDPTVLQKWKFGVNGKETFSSTNGSVIDTVAGAPTVIGNRSTLGGSTSYQGTLNEIIVYSGGLTNNEEHRITSYLACKYGMTLDQSSPTDYILSNDTVIWNATTAGTKNKNIGCVAKDDDTSLNQMKSKTLNSSNDVTVEVVNKGAVVDKSALTWGHDDGNLIFQSSGIRSGFWRVGREYATMGTDTIGDVKVSIPKSSLPSTGQNAKYYLFKIPSSANGDFTSNDMIPVLGTINGSDIEFLTNFTSGDHFTLGRDEVSGPGGVSGVDFTLWLKGNVGYSTGSTDTWYDQSPYGNDFTQNNNSLKPLSGYNINGNNAFSFDGVRLFEKTNTKSNAFMNIPGGTSSTGEGSIFLVYIPESVGMTSIFKQYNSYTPFNFNASTANAGFYIRNGSASSTIPYDSVSSTIPRISSAIINGGNVKSYVSGGNEATSSVGNELIMQDGNAADIGGAFNGKIAELITYKSAVSANAKSSIESYLACKYGITLEQGVSGQNYYLSDRSVIWDAIENTGFRNSVGCIARDESSSFYQTGSKNTESNAGGISVSASTLSDKLSLTWSDDGLSYSDWTFKFSPIGYKKLLKSWRFSEKGGDVGTVKISIPKIDIPQHNGTVVLLKDTDTDFSSGSSIITGVENNGNLEFDTNVADGDFITFAYEPTKGLAFWIKADSNLFNATNSVTGTPSFVDEWRDVGNSFSFKQLDGSATPQIKLNSINGNPTVSFDGINDSLSATGLILENSLQKEIFIVNNNGNSSNGPIFFQGDETSNYSPYFGANGKFTQMNYVGGQDSFLGFSNDNAPNIYSVRYEYSQTGSSNAYVLKNGGSEASLAITDEPFQTADITKSTIGGRLQGTSEFFGGDVAEVIAYSTGLTSIERNKILSYLYIKYGINPNQATPQSIINSNGDNVWNSTENVYNHDIASISRDDYFSLNQKASRSSSFSGELKVSVSNIDTDKKSLSWGNNYGDYLWQNTESPVGYKRMTREWRFQELNGDIGDVTISMQDSLLPSGFGGDLLLYVDDDGDFGNGVKATYTGTLSGNDWTFPAFNVDNGDYATIGYYSNVPPTDVKIGTGYTASLNENNLIGDKIEDINGYDPNDDPLVYSLSCTVPGTDDSNFSITGSGLYAAVSFNYESPNDFNADNSYDVCIRATDIIGSKYDKHITVNVNGVNEAPSMLMLSADQIIENLGNNILIGSIIPSDVDSSSFIYEFATGTGSDDNSLFSIVNDNELRINSTTDYETKTSYSIRLKVSDDQGLSIERDFIINVIDVDDFKPTINITDDAEVGPVVSDDVSFTVGDTGGSNLMSVAKAYSPDNICNGSDSFDLLSFSGASPSFTISQANELKNGTYLCIRAEDNAGNIEYAIASNPYYLDNTPPSDPTVLTPEQPTGLINTRTPTITGTGEIGTNVKAYIGATELCSATVMTGGVFSCGPFTQPLSEGTNALTVKSCDSSFPTPNCSAEVNFSILSDTESPTIMDIISHQNGGKYQNIIAVTGTGEKFMTSKIEIYDSTGSIIGTWTGGIDNATYFTLNTNLSNLDEGNYSMSGYIIDTIGNVSPVKELNFIIDKTAPTDITYLTPSNGNLSNNIHPTITGTGEAFGKAYIKFGGTTYSSTITSTGSWSIYINDSLSDGANSIEGYQEDEALNRSSSVFLTLNVDTTPPSNPTISTPTDGKHINDKNPTISGSGEANEMYWLELNGKTYTGVISPVGSWSVPIIEDLPDMNFTATVKSLDTLGNETPFVPSNFTVDTSSPLTPSIVSPLTGVSTTDVRPTIIANGENDIPSFIEFKTSTGLIVMTLSGVSTVDGDFVLTPNADLPDNIYDVVAYQIDFAGNASPQTSITITIDTTAPDKPTITTPAFSQVINNKNPTITGSGEIGATIRILIDGSDSMTGVVAPDGSWSLNTNFNLIEGNHTVLANLIDTEGNVGPNESSSFSVDTNAPASITITYPSQPNGLINTTTPIILGNTELSSNVVVKSNTGTVLATCIANVDGDYSCGPVSMAFEQGINEFTVESCDHSTPTPNCISNSGSVNVDSISPNMPTLSFPIESEMINDSTPTITGSGEAGVSVSIKIGSNTYSSTVDGSGSFVVTYPDNLIDGDYSVDVWLKDSAENQSAVKTVNFSVDTGAPIAPIILSPSNGNISADTTPTITGKSENNAIITITANSKTYTGTANGVGDWTIGIIDALSPDGSFSIIATQTDKAGNVSPTASISVTIDTTPPPSITIDSPNGLISDNTPVVSGTGEIGGNISILIGGNTYNTSVLGDGTWSLTVFNALSDGSNSGTGYIVDSSGNRSVSDTEFSFSIDSTPPNAPTISTPTHNEFVKTALPIFTGSGEIGSLVTLTITPNSYTGIVDSSGSFSINTTNSLSDSNYSASINLTDALGNVSSSAVRLFYIDTTAPNAPTVSTPTDNQIFNTGSFSISGNGEIPSIINVYIDSVLSYTGVSDGAGHFNIPLSGISDGVRTIDVEQIDIAGNNSPKTTLSVLIDSINPGTPTILSPDNFLRTKDNRVTLTATGEFNANANLKIRNSVLSIVQSIDVPLSGTGYVEILSDALTDDDYVFILTLSDIAGNTSSPALINVHVDTTPPSKPNIITLTPGYVSSDNTPMLSGTGENTTAYELVVDSTDTYTGSLSGTGYFEFDTLPLIDGNHTINVRLTDDVGNVGGYSDDITFSVDTTPPVLATISSPLDNVGLTKLSNPIFSGSGEALSNLSVLDGSGVVICSTTVDGSGSFICGPSTKTFTDGLYNLDIKSCDSAMTVPNCSTATGSITVDLTPPNDIVIVEPFNGSYTSNASKLITGTAEPHSVVNITVGGSSYTGSSDENGDWSITPNALPDGVHTINGHATDLAGNVGNDTFSSFTVDTIPPEMPGVGIPTDGAYINNNKPYLSGTGEANMQYDITIDGYNYTGSVLPDGTWSLSTPDTLTDGTKTVYVLIRDLAGNESPEKIITINLDSSNPSAILIISPSDDKYVGDNTPTLSGLGEAGATVSIDINSNTYTGVVDMNGSWSLNVSNTLPDGTYAITGFQTDLALNVSPLNNISIHIDTTAPIAPTITAPTNATISSNTMPVISFDGEQYATFDVYDGLSHIGFTTVGISGSGSFILTGSLSEGSHNIKVSQKDRAGNVSIFDTITYVVDTTAPNSPTFETPTEGLSYSDSGMTVYLSGESNASAYIELNGTPLTGPFILSNTGSLYFTGLTLIEGFNTLYATITDGAGNVSTGSLRTFAYDSTAPTIPTISTPIDGSLTNTGTIIFSGSGETSSNISVLNSSGSVLCSATAMTGSYSCIATTGFVEGSNSFTVKSCDVSIPNPNCSTATGAVIIDTVKPSTPSILSHIEGGIYSLNDVLLYGTGEADTNLEMSLSGSSYTGVVSSTGTYSFQSDYLSEGLYTFNIRSLDTAGNIGDANHIGFRIDRTPPTAISILSPIQPNGYQKTLLVKFSGTGEINSDIVVKNLSGSTVCSTTVNGSGAFECTAGTGTLSEGLNVLSINNCDNASPVKNCSDTGLNTYIDSIIPSSVGITSPSNGSVVESSPITIKATGEPNASFSFDINGHSYSGTVNSSGSISLSFTPWAVGSYYIKSKQVDIVGNESVESTSSFIYSPTSTSTSGGGGGYVSMGSVSGGYIPAFCNLYVSKTASTNNDITYMMTWKTYYATTAIMDNGIGSLSIGNKQKEIKVTYGKVSKYTLSVDGLGGKGSCSVDIGEVKTTVTSTGSNNAVKPDTTIQPNTSLKELPNISGSPFNVCKGYVRVLNDKDLIFSDLGWEKEFVENLAAYRSLSNYEIVTRKISPEVKAKGIINNSELFQGERNLTRAEFLKMVVNAVGCKYKPTTKIPTYNDIDKSDWYYQYVAFAQSEGWIGQGASFRPNDYITRGEVSKILIKSTGVKIVMNTTKNIFDDIPANMEFAPYVGIMKKYLIVSGQTVGNKSLYRPNDNISRAEIAKILSNTFVKGNTFSSTK